MHYRPFKALFAFQLATFGPLLHRVSLCNTELLHHLNSISMYNIHCVLQLEHFSSGLFNTLAAESDVTSHQVTSSQCLK